MHNRAFFERVLRAVEVRLGNLPQDVDKSEALRLLTSRAGASSLFSLGREIWGTDDHPVLDALVRTGEVMGILDRWMLLERFSHTHNRTRIVDVSATTAGLRVVLEHHAEGDRAVDAESHLFVWGVVAGLFERAHLPAERVLLCNGNTLLWENGVLAAFRDLPPQTQLAEFTWTTTSCRERPLPLVAALPPSEAVRQLLASDVTRAFKVHEVARHLGVSSRTLQRSLQATGESFSGLVRKTRLARARELLNDARLSLADVAFAAGFSDQAHLARVARTHWLLAPSQFRALVVF